MDFTSPYRRDAFLDFCMHNFLPEDFVPNTEAVSSAVKTTYTKNVVLLGECPSLKLNIYEIQHASENDPRISLSKETFKLMADNLVSRALVIFKSESSNNYRLSLITLEYRIENGTLSKEFSNPRRYSFFLGPQAKVHTPEQFLLKKGRVSTFEDLQNRFSVEVVNKEFYNEIAVLFTELVGGERKIGRRQINEKGKMRLPDKPIKENHQLYQEFAVRLIGRLVFCWFLKKKSSNGGPPLVDDAYLSTAAVKEYPGYYHTILEPLFFEVLNTPMDERHDMVKDIFKNTPFLNGGLFEPHEDDFYDTDSLLNASRYLNTLNIPDEWFIELFEVFEIYNFTIDENTTIDVELSIDPEMLGRIFENLLAEINPETGETARKATGSYYTPRPIVEYMVDESLKQYLKTKVDIDDASLDKLLSYSEDVELTAAQNDAVIDALDDLKALDPACGSGAFPMGLLQKMLLILQKVDPHAEAVKRRLLDSIADPIYKSMLSSKLKEHSDWLDYPRKLNIIRKCIYGIDIQPIAAEISKLRFFLSLVVDDVVQDNEDNRGIHTLPNLEFKFVSANTLIGLGNEDMEEDQADLFADDFFYKFQELVDEYFSATTKDDKKSLRKKILKLVDKKIEEKVGLIQTLSEFTAEKKKRQSRQLLIDAHTDWVKKWDSYKNLFLNKTVEFFEIRYFFPECNKGFDIVIGNPPYGVSIKGQYRKDVEFFLGHVPDYEIYYYFIEVGHFLLNENGALAYIVPNTFLFNVYARNYRLTLLARWDLFILDCTKFKLFDAATVRNSVIIFNKSNQDDFVRYKNTKSCTTFESLINTPTKFSDDKLFKLGNTNWGLLFCLEPAVLSLISKIKQISKPLSEFFPEMSQGLIAYDKYQGQDENTIENRVFHFSKKVKDTLKPWLWGQDVKRYSVKWNGQEYIDYCNGIANPRSPKFFKGHRLLIREITNPSIYAAYTRDELYNDPAIIIVLESKIMDIKVPLAILNSTLASFYHFNNSPKATKGDFPKILVKDVQEFPIPEMPLNVQNLFANIVKEILDAKSHDMSNDKTSKEKIIDLMVYNLYDLTYDEVRIIDPEINRLISREDYERASIEELSEWEVAD